MGGDDNNIELIDLYLSGEMSNEETEAFEDRLEHDREFRENYEHQLDTQASIKTYHFKANLANLHREHMKNETAQRHTWTYVSGIAASLLLLVASYYIFSSEQVPPNDLFQSYFEPYPVLDIVRGDDGPFTKALDKYTRQQYDSAIEVFKSIEVKPKHGEKLNLYLAVSHLASNNFNKAEELLLQIQETGIYGEQANWYLAMVHLASGDKHRATQRLKSIKPNQYKFNEADEILDEL